MKEDFHTVETSLIVKGVFKCILAVSISLVLVFWAHSCTLKPETMQECTEACESAGSSMQSVTEKECICAEKSSTNNWVLPRN